MKTLIERLVKSGNAYVAEDNILFNVPSMPNYGKLSGRPLDEMIAGARVEVAPYKKDPTDFILWKPSKPGEPSWPSPAGVKTPGRPGWHIECSAMAWKHLGETFDIHGGGIDLVFPHHENEIAQSRCAFHTGVMANYWMHNGFLQVEGEKMSKSIGNFVTIRELLVEEAFGGRQWSPQALRLAMLRTHYTQPIDWTVRNLKEAEGALEGWSRSIKDEKGTVSQKVLDALADDLNTPLAVAEIYRHWRAGEIEAVVGSLALLGFDLRKGAYKSPLRRTLEKTFAAAGEKEKVDSLIAARNAARARKDFKESDRIRDELAAMGIALKDSKDGTTWELAR
jgi:cysteinyl-tRNA synthetase